MSRKVWICLVGSSVALAFIGLGVAVRRNPHYSDLIPLLRIGQCRAEIKDSIHRLGLQFKDDVDAVYVGNVTPLNMLREEQQLVLCFDRSDCLAMAYEDIIYRYDDVGSRDVEIRRAP